MCILHCLHFLPCWPLLFHVCSSERNADACAWCNFNSCSEFPCPPFLVSEKEKRDRNVPYNVYSCCSFTALTLAVDPKLSLPCCSFFFSPRLSFLFPVSVPPLSFHLTCCMAWKLWRKSASCAFSEGWEREREECLREWGWWRVRRTCARPKEII